jgi:hypothetical protein
MHALAAAAVWVSLLPIGIKWAATAVIIASQLCQRARSSARPALGHLRYLDDRGWFLEGADGAIQPLEISGSTVATPWVVFLHARSDRTRYAWALFKNSGDGDSFRRLRVCLRVGPVKGPAGRGLKRASNASGERAM